MAVCSDQLSSTVIQYAMCRLSQTPQKNKHGEGSTVVIYEQFGYKVILKKLQQFTEMDKKLIEQRCSPKFGSLVSDIIYGIFWNGTQAILQLTSILPLTRINQLIISFNISAVLGYDKINCCKARKTRCHILGIESHDWAEKTLQEKETPQTPASHMKSL